MIKLSKRMLFFLMILNSTLAGITLVYVDWSVFETKQGIYDEIHQPILFLLLSLYFMVPYVRKLKEKRKGK